MQAELLSSILEAQQCETTEADCAVQWDSVEEISSASAAARLRKQGEQDA